MKKLYISEFFPPFVKGGAEISTASLVKLDAKKHDCFVLTSDFQKTPWDYESAKIFPRLKGIGLGRKGISDAVIYAIKILIVPFYNALVIYFFVNKHKIDAIQLNSAHYYYMPILVAAILTKKPVLIDVRDYSLVCPTQFSSSLCLGIGSTSHGYNCLRGYTPNSKYLRPFNNIFARYESTLFNIYKFIFRLISHKYNNFYFVPISNYVRNVLIFNGYPQTKMHTVYNFISEDQLKDPSNYREKAIVYAGRIEKSKGIWDTLEAFESLNYENLKLLIVGEGTEYASVKSYISNKNLEKKVILLGKIKQQEVIDIYSKSLIVVAPSVWPEPFGRFIIEAMASCTPLITTKSGGITEIINMTRCGLLVTPSNSKELSLAINLLLNDNALYDELVSNILKNRHLFTSKNGSHPRENLFEDLISRCK